LKVVVAVEDRRVVFAADVAGLAAGGWSIVAGATWGNWRAADIGADIVQILTAATVRHALGGRDPMLDAIADQQNLNLLRCSAGGSGRWTSWRNSAVDTRFARPEVRIVRAAGVELEVVGWDQEAMTLADEQPGWNFGCCRGRWWRSSASFDEAIFGASFLGNVVDRWTTALIVGVWDFPADAFTNKGDLLNVDWWWGWGRWWLGRDEINDSAI
jgi:hypothetical protein